jgi:MFS family permease
MISNRNNSRRNSTTGRPWQELKKPQFYKPFIIMILFFTIQQFSGIFTIFIYAAQFSIEAGVSIDEFLCTVIIGLIRCCTVIIVSFASDTYGRKPIATISTVGMCLNMLGLVICSIFSLELKQSTIFWLPTVFLFLFIFFGTFGVLTLPFAMIAEVYPQNTRGLAVGLTICYAYIMSFINVKTFTAVFSIFGSVTVFSFYGVVSLMGIAFAVMVLPETKGKTLHEIECYFRK